MRYILIAIVLLSCESKNELEVSEKDLLNQDYSYWKDFNVYAKDFSDTIITVSIDSNRVIEKHIFVPLRDSISLEHYFEQNMLIDFIEKDSPQYEYKYSRKSKKMYKIFRYKKKLEFVQMDKNYSLDAGL